MKGLGSFISVLFSRVTNNISFILFLILLGNRAGYSQVIQGATGIPVIIFPEKLAPDISLTDYQNMKSMGVDAICDPKLYPTEIEKCNTAGLRVIPDQWYIQGEYIKKYTDAHYTVWEAEPLYEGQVHWISNTSLTEGYIGISLPLY